MVNNLKVLIAVHKLLVFCSFKFVTLISDVVVKLNLYIDFSTSKYRFTDET